MINGNCPCKKKKCPRHGNCDTCRRHHAESMRKRPVYCERKIAVRKFRNGDEAAVSDVIRTTLTVSNLWDYPPEFIKDNIESHSPEVMAKRAAESHFYVALDGKKSSAAAESQDIGAAQPKAIWFPFSSCRNIREEVLAEESLRHWRRMSILYVLGERK